MTYDFVSVQGLGGGMELGIVQSGGFELKHRTGGLDLGAPVVEANRRLIGWNWDSLFTSNQHEWKIVDAPFVSANAPCSAWSTLTRKDLRGSGAKVMQYTDEIFDYAVRMRQAPLVIANESVQQAFSTGRAYYQEKRDFLEAKTGRKYDLVWAMHSNASLGGASRRKRVFVIYTQIPFGVEYAQPNRVARFGDAIRDLEGLALNPGKQPYRRPPTWWSVARRASDGVDGHFNVTKVNENFNELMETASEIGEPWLPGEPLEAILRRVHSVVGRLPHEWQRQLDKLAAKNFSLGMNQTSMWDPAAEGRVVTGTGPYMSVHYAEPRLLTYRECFRLQGFPDTWRLWPVRDYKKLGSVPGKGVPVDAGRWLGTWVKAALDGAPGTVQGETIGDRERKIDITGAYKHTMLYERPWDYSANTIHEQHALQLS